MRSGHHPTEELLADGGVIAMMWWYGDGMGGWGYALMAVSTVLFWGLLILAVVALVRSLGRQGRSGTARTSAEQLLAERFARGEIDGQEYRERLDTLRSGNRLLRR
jgi:putative membrane protein